jgi:WD40 repeat protein
MIGHQDKVGALAISSRGTIASGDKSGRILFWDGHTGRPLRVFAKQRSIVGSLQFSPDGRLLLSTCGQGGSDCHEQIWSVATGRMVSRHKIDDHIVVTSAFSPDGLLAATAGGEFFAVSVWDPLTGKTVALLKGSGKPIREVGVSDSGEEIVWGTIDPCPQETFCPNKPGIMTQSLRLPIGPPLPPKAFPQVAGGLAFSQARSKFADWVLQHRKSDAKSIYFSALDISKGGQTIASINRDPKSGFGHLTYSFSPDGANIISGGSSGVISAYGLDGAMLGNYVGHQGDVWSISPSPDGKLLVSGGYDQTVRLWNLKTRELLATLFNGSDDQWVMWVPQGFFTASGPGAELVGWQINNGPEHEADYVTGAQLRRHLDRPDIVARAIELASADAAVKEAHGANVTIAELLATPVPRLRILAPEAHMTLSGGHVQLKVDLVSRPDPVKIVRIQVNGRQVTEITLPRSESAVAPDIPNTLSFNVPLSRGSNKITVAAANDTGETVGSVTVNHEGEGDLDRRGTLYILAIGVDDYRSLGDICGNGKESCDLSFAGADATSFANAMETRAGPIHASVSKRVLINGGASADLPTANNIRNALGILRSAKSNDTVAVFVSGHGVNERSSYRFVPTDGAWGANGLLQPATTVEWFAFQEALTSAGGRRLLFLDTCHAGNAFNPRFLSDSFEANILVYSSARWDQLALEDVTLAGGHGLFTFALVEGIEGGARNSAGDVRAVGLSQFVAARVRLLAKARSHSQEPQFFRARDADDYVLAHIDGQ